MEQEEGYSAVLLLLKGVVKGLEQDELPTPHQVQLPQLLLCHVTQHPDPSFPHKSQSNAPAAAGNEAPSNVSCQCQRLLVPKGDSEEMSTVLSSFLPL